LNCRDTILCCWHLRWIDAAACSAIRLHALGQSVRPGQEAAQANPFTPIFVTDKAKTKTPVLSTSSRSPDDSRLPVQPHHGLRGRAGCSP
jgi:hypothetical protein